MISINFNFFLTYQRCSTALDWKGESNKVKQLGALDP
jgi:hypothetical protein